MATDRQQLFSGTEIPPAHLALDVHKLGHYLADYIEGLGGDIEIEKFKGGQSNPTYKVSSRETGKTFVLRRRPPGELLASAHDVAREFRVISALARVNFPVPIPYHFCEDESVIGSEFYVVSHCEGQVYWNNELPGAPGKARVEIYKDMAARLAELHHLDHRAIGLEGLGRSGQYVERNFARWAKVYQQSKLVEIPDMVWLMNHLQARIPQNQPVSLIHGDFGLYNIIIDTDRPRVKAVLDWEMSTLGDPFVDLAHHLRAWWEPLDDTGAASSLRGQNLAILGIPSMDEHIEQYCRVSGIAEMPHRQFYLGFCQFRYAAMIQGILKRASIGTSASRRVLHNQERVFEMAAMARRTLEHAE